MRKHTLTAIGTALLLGTAGIAAAQTATPTTPGRNGTTATTPSATSPSVGSTFNQSLRGKDVVNVEGDTIGEVKGVQGDNLVVSVGGFLGIGERDVALSRSQVSITGVGDDQKLVTSLTKDELKAMPEVAMDSSSRPGSASMPRTSDSGMTAPSGTPVAPGTTAGTAATTAALDQSLRGKDIENLEGDSIGEVKRVEGDRLVVSVGGFLGIGARDVALSRSQVSITGVGDDRKLVTSLTKDELKAMPEVAASDAPRTGTTPMPRDSGATAPGGTRPTR